MEAIIKTIKVSEKGQIALPKDVRESADICVGDTLVLVQKGKSIILEKTDRIEKKMRDEFKDLQKLSELSLKKIWDNPGDEIWGSYLRKK
ncbi:MAG TPA: AbrB/MazE/SpoVT family DNA-binding domain-containing protein [Candidatus Nanoarchaeia archaeon]|nr:AbrB/MazE/SpoVT family DNA-binding domain-containing protein [Candidatus Nanoarchaeia archaeon]